MPTLTGKGVILGMYVVSLPCRKKVSKSRNFPIIACNFDGRQAFGCSERNLPDDKHISLCNARFYQFSVP